MGHVFAFPVSNRGAVTLDSLGFRPEGFCATASQQSRGAATGGSHTLSIAIAPPPISAGRTRRRGYLFMSIFS
ncbi:hypothetical protein RBSH_04625 [Rhodopirellula baltica SH28]|uniref:Uncharacterized protein n=1 Tax=Rhodopirellula baltica SH28 TaxID=993517 RepID=K5D0T9_RHOBT|nr:hypothetical protein RBSH_04625 [Rhodopirellula baltica SH28]